MLCGGLVRAKCNVRGWGDGAGVRLTEGSIYRESEQVGVKNRKDIYTSCGRYSRGAPRMYDLLLCYKAGTLHAIGPSVESTHVWN